MSSSNSSSSNPNRNKVEEESQRLFKRLELTLKNNVDDVYFDEPRLFKSLIKVVEVFDGKAEEMENDNFDLVASLKAQSGEYGRLFEQQETVHDVIEEVVKFEHGLSNSVDTMGDVIEKYKKSKDDILLLQQQLLETKSVLTARQTGSSNLVSLKELWLQKAEYEESLRILNELERLKAAPMKVERYLKDKKYLNAVLTLNAGIENMFNEDLCAVAGFEDVRIKLMEYKGNILEALVKQLKDVVFDLNPQGRLNHEGLLDDDERSDTRSLWGANQTVHEFYGGSTTGYLGGGGGMGGSGTFFNNMGTMNMNGSILADDEDTKAVLQRISCATSVETRHEVLEEISWSMDLQDPELNAAVEEELDAPESMGSIFTRLIMKACSELKSEDDVERMLLNQLSGQFQIVTKSIKEWAMMFPRTAYSMHTHTAAHSHSLTHMHGMTVVRRGSGGGDGHIPEKSAAGGGDTAAAAGSAVSAAESKLFVRYVKHLLGSAFLSLRRLVYILRLLSLTKKLRDGDEHPYAYEMKESVRKQVLGMWADIEEMIIGELKRHFVERDVENITDGVGGGSGSGAHNNTSAGGMGGGPGVGLDGLGEGHGDAFSSPYDDVNGSGGGGGDSNPNDDDDDGEDDYEAAERNALICSPTSRLAAPVYREVTAFTERSRELLQSEVDWDLSPNTGGKILASVQIFIDGELMPVILGSVNQVMRDLQMNTQYFSLPTADARRVGASASVAASLTSHRGIGPVDAEGSGVGDSGNGIGNRDRTTSTDRHNSAAPICLASQMCAKRSKPLFIYWLQLPQHRDAVSTILERMIRGYSSSAREEVDAFSWRWLSADAKYKVPVGEAMRVDPLFVVYRQHMFDGRSSVDDFIGGTHSSGSGGGAGGNKYPTKKGIADGSHGPSSAGIAGTSGGARLRGYSSDSRFAGSSSRNQHQLQHYEQHGLHGSGSGDNNNNSNNNSDAGARDSGTAGELFAWGPLWDVGNGTSYPASSDKIARDFADISSVAAIVHGCAWLSSQLCRGCVSISKKSALQASRSRHANGGRESSSVLRYSGKYTSKYVF